MATTLNPYFNFASGAREAMEFYQSVFGGELTVSTYGESGQGDASEADKTMHAQLETPSGYTLMASDTPNGMPAQPISGITISLSGDDDAELSGYWDKLLAGGGTVAMPLETAPWGDKFGMLTDRFGVSWFVNITGAHPQG